APKVDRFDGGRIELSTDRLSQMLSGAEVTFQQRRLGEFVGPPLSQVLASGCGPGAELRNDLINPHLGLLSPKAILACPLMHQLKKRKFVSLRLFTKGSTSPNSMFVPE